MSHLVRQTKTITVSFPGDSPYSEAFNVSDFAWGVYTGPLDENYLNIYGAESENGTYRAVTSTDGTRTQLKAPADALYVALPEEALSMAWVKFVAVDADNVPVNTFAQDFTVILKS